MLSAQANYIGRPWLRPNAERPCHPVTLCTPCRIRQRPVHCTKGRVLQPGGVTLVRAKSYGNTSKNRGFYTVLKIVYHVTRVKTV